MEELSAEKPEHQPFPLEFVENAPAAQLLYRRYDKLKKSLNIHRTDKLERVRVRLNTGKFTARSEPNSIGRAGSQVALKNLAAVMEKRKTEWYALCSNLASPIRCRRLPGVAERLDDARDANHTPMPHR